MGKGIAMDRVEDYTVVDLEMTGLNPKTDKIIEIGAVKVRRRTVVDTCTMLVCPGRPIPENVAELTGITDAMAAGGEQEDTAVDALLTFIGDDVVVGHNVGFDYSFLKQWAANHRRPLALNACDTLRFARVLLSGEQSKRLESLCEFFQIPRENAHRALADALETQRIYECLADMAQQKEPQLLVPKPLLYKAKRQTPATAHQIERLKEFRESHHIEDIVCWETLTRSEASRLQDRYYATYGKN